MFNALVVEKNEEGKTSAAVHQIGLDDLPAGDVTVAVAYSTVNYKDGLCIGPGGGLVRTGSGHGGSHGDVGRYGVGGSRDKRWSCACDRGCGWCRVCGYGDSGAFGP